VEGCCLEGQGQWPPPTSWLVLNWWWGEPRPSGLGTAECRTSSLCSRCCKMFLPKLPAEGNTAGSLGLGPEAADLGKSILKPSLLCCKQSGKHQDSHRNNKPVIKITKCSCKMWSPRSGPAYQNQ
jgi:hypothetical protein